jgi:hypothetical protein
LIWICEMTATLITLEVQLVHHFVAGAGIDTIDINTTTILVLLVLVLSNSPVLLPCFSKSRSKSHYDQQSVGQSVLVSGAHLGPTTNFSISLRFSFRQLLFVML